jgi:hypothetical protein
MAVPRGWCTAVLLTSFAVGGAVPAIAAPTDEPPPDPASAPAPTGLIPPIASITNVLGQNGSTPAGPLGLPDLSAYAPSLVLGQNPVPAAPGATEAAVVPNLNAFNAAYLLPQNLTPAAPGQGEPAPGIGPNQDSPGTGRIAFLRRLHEMYGAGALTGALLGQIPKEQLGEPLPGTAPGPEIYIPPGLGFAQPDLPDPTLPAG